MKLLKMLLVFYMINILINGSIEKKDIISSINKFMIE